MPGLKHVYAMLTQPQAFPVLCRILTELKLLQTPVGVVVLSAGIGNDVTGWILLALCVALVNSGAGITAVWILLVAIGYALFLVFGIRPAFLWILRRTGSLQNGPPQSVVALTILMVLASAFFTGVIGIHPIFGAFMVGLICPHEGGFAIKLTEKIEDLVSVLFLPLYFALSGLSTNLGLLDNGITWAYVVGVTSIAFTAKIAGGTFASWLNGLVFRESLTIGVLMSCKGLVELIVLNIGLQAKILSTRTFTIFVVMALVTTFATTPLTTLLYPKWYQDKLDMWKKGKIDWDGNPILPDDTSSSRAKDSSEASRPTVARSLLVYLRLDGLPSLFTLVSLMGNPTATSTRKIRQHHTFEDRVVPNTKEADTALQKLRSPLKMHGLRLFELTDRDSSVMQVSEIQSYASRDPIIKAFQAFATLNNLATTGGISVIPEHSYANTLLSQARDSASDLVIIPWSETGSMSEQPSFTEASQWRDPLANKAFASFVDEIFEKAANMHVGVFVDRSILPASRAFRIRGQERPTRMLTRTSTGISLQDHQKPVLTASNSGYHLLVPFFGGEDDCFAVRLALQIAYNEDVTVTILLMTEPSSSASGFQNATDDAAFFFRATKSNLPAALATRVVFEECAGQAAEGLKSAISSLDRAFSTGDKPEQILLHGLSGMRNTTSWSYDQPSAGVLSATVLNALQEAEFETSLLIVQAKKEGELGGSGILKGK
jgi:Kef-type K+ transport system membrane component KefB